MAEVGSPEPWVRAAALPALARMEREEFALVLANLDPDPVWFVRAGLAAALAIAGDEASQARLLAMLKDDDVRVLPAVLEALRQARGPDSVDTLRRHLDHPDFAVRMAAADQLAGLEGHRPQRGAGRRPGPRPRRRRDGRAPLAGAAAGPAEGRAGGGPAARDGEPAIRRGRCASVRPARCARWERRHLPPGPEPIVRPALDYREALAPYEVTADAPVFTPRVFLHTKHGRIEIHLNVVEAPLMSATFLDLARRGFYDGLTFHRVVPGFVVQGGDPRGDGNGGPGFALRDEIGERPYGRGVVGMALSGKDTGGSQLFITLAPAPAPRRPLHRLRLGGLRHGGRGQDPARRRDREGRGLDRPLTARYRLLALDIDGTLLGGDKTDLAADAAGGGGGARGRRARRPGHRPPLSRRPPRRRAARPRRSPRPASRRAGRGAAPGDGSRRRAPHPALPAPGPRSVVRQVVRLGRECGADPVVHCGFRGEGRLVVAGIAADNAMLLGYVDRGGRDRVQVEDLERDLPDDGCR